MNANTGNLSLPLDFKMYLSKDYCQKNNLEFKSKLDLALELVESLNFVKDNTTYLLMDKWSIAVGFRYQKYLNSKSLIILIMQSKRSTEK
ncbi:MAG: hypothetical protein ACRC5T_00640 [Cetobacterium sp.]